jgi:hypothetical protein
LDASADFCFLELKPIARQDLPPIPSHSPLQLAASQTERPSSTGKEKEQAGETQEQTDYFSEIAGPNERALGGKQKETEKVRETFFPPIFFPTDS